MDGRGMSTTASPTIVVGAGIIGVTIAYDLQRRGRPVVLVDRDEPGRGASYGNMASIAVSEFMPASRPSMWRQMPGWLLDPEGPVRLRPSYLPRLTPWFLRFVAASRPAKVRELEAAGAALCGRVYDDLLPLLEAAGLSHMLSAEGCLCVYGSEAEFAADREHIEVIERFGIAHELLDADRIRVLEPAVGAAIRRALLLPQNRSISDPFRLVTELADRFRALGGRIVTGEVGDVLISEGRVTTIVLKDGESLAASEVVLAAGAYTARLARRIGEPLPIREDMPLETERGYHTQIMAPGISLRHSIIWPARAFMVTPTAGGLRVGGTVEMAGLDAPPDYRRARVLVKRAREALPGLKVDEVSEWMGHRPAFPDTVPVISASAKLPGLYYATGHGHLGLTYAATTARLVADLMTGRTPPIDMRPYRVDRF